VARRPQRAATALHAGASIVLLTGNEEQNTPVMVCDDPRRTWSQEWTALRHLG